MNKVISHKVLQNELLWVYSRKSILSLHLAGALLALLAPLEVLSRYPAADEFVRVVDLVLPMVGNFALRSTFPQPAQLYGAFMVLTVPLLVWLHIRGPHFRATIERMEVRLHDSAWLLIAATLLAIASPAGLYVYVFLATPSDYHLFPFHSERWALAVFGPVVYCWAPAVAVFWPVWVVTVLRQLRKGA